MTLCALCQATTQSLGICPKCHRKLSLQLDDLPELWSQAHGELQPSKSGNGGRSNERTLGVNINALSFINGADIVGTLQSWESLIRDECKLTPFDRVKKSPDLSQQIDSVVAFTLHHLQWLGQSEFIEDFARELGELHQLGMTAARKFVEKQTRIACPSERSDGLPCGRNLTIEDGADLLASFECRGCKSQWTALRLVAVALSTPGTKFMLDAESIALFIKIPELEVHKLAKRFDIRMRSGQYDLTALTAARMAEIKKAIA